jgi:hypothetical protein
MVPQPGGRAVTIDEELNHLEDCIRRLKVEYDIYFGGGGKKVPNDLEWRVRSLIKKFSDSQRLSAQQRFHYNTMVERYAIYSDLWRQKLRIKEEGYRRPQDAMLGIQGLRSLNETKPPAPKAHSVVLTFAESDELESIRELYRLLGDRGASSTHRAPEAGQSIESFAAFLRGKTRQLQSRYGCRGVEYTVQVKDGRARIKARPSL